MNNCKTIIRGLLLSGAILTLPACNGIFEDIYDKVETSSEFGFIDRIEGLANAGTIYVDATSYTRWNYLDLHTLRADTVNISVGGIELSSWDIAIHRYDVKTNGATALRTDFTSLDDLVASGRIPTGNYVADEFTTSVIVVDMSHMMDGWLDYIDSDYNRVISSWLDVDTSSMPPIYTKSDNVFVLHLADGSYAAIQLADFMDKSGVKGFMTVRYIYPLSF